MQDYGRKYGLIDPEISLLNFLFQGGFPIHILSSLKLVNIEKIRLHEPTEKVRSITTLKAIQREGKLRNPLLAMAIPENKYLILDGAHRTTALGMLGCKRVPIQLVDSSDVKLDAWEHLVSSGSWLEQVKQDSTLCWISTVQKELPIVEVVESSGRKHFVYAKTGKRDLLARLHTWHRIVATYNRDYQVNRFPNGTCLRPDSNQVLVRHPNCTISELKKIVSVGQTVPAGVTRSIVEGRLLNLGIPLDLLKSPLVNRKEWNQLCNQWSEKLRHYSESIYLCEA
ncbi:ParB N-terminal domain-containing protein [Shimazuella kribbensis]|uniref:ParB N-terminal domain-containing protein n=1 Tax=Shimazuella kribbensis TaxID=139808 RepID=UPI0003F50BD2|nr:ParB N-terminal domain-containing protein [Shimazuella kribbensis]